MLRPLALTASGAGHAAEVRRASSGCVAASAPMAVLRRGSVPESTWLTALTLLLPAGTKASIASAPSLDGRATGRESGWVNRLRLGCWVRIPQADSMIFDGWPGTRDRRLGRAHCRLRPGARESKDAAARRLAWRADSRRPQLSARPPLPRRRLKPRLDPRSGLRFRILSRNHRHRAAGAARRRPARRSRRV